ncbi:MAG: C39 family peptidase [Clostridiales bacterium]|nr:C39 family peptidase [Clostridiales bacterium]
MSKHTVTINEEYFAYLGALYRGAFSDVNEAISYAEKTPAEGLFDLFGLFKKIMDSYQSSLDYDITCISSVFKTADAEMKKRAEDLIGQDIINTVSNGGSVVIDYYDIKPDLEEPRQLDHTQYGYTKDADGNLVYDHPKETEEYLHRNQGEAYELFQGTCGLCSCANILRLAGVNATEQEIVDYAIEHNLCTKNSSDSGENGGTVPGNWQAILGHYGISSKCVTQDINTIASSIEQGKGVIVAVDPHELNPNVYSPGGYHAITVTSVVRDADGRIKGFYVCDSNADVNDYCRENLTNYYSVDTFEGALTDVFDMLVTDSAIR